MLRPFHINSDDLVYTADVAEFVFPRTTQGAARCAIVGIRYETTGDDPIALGFIDGWSTNIERLTVAGRNYMQGAFPLPLIAHNFAQALNGPYGFAWVNRFLGSHIALPNNYQGAGVLGAGMALGPADTVRMRLRRIGGGNFVSKVTLECVQFPKDEPINAGENLVYKLLAERGIGEPYFVGQEIDWPGGGATEQLEVLPQSPAADTLRRTGFRGILINPTDGTVIGIAKSDPATPAINNVSAQVWTSFSRPPMNGASPATAILGTIGNETTIGLIDMSQDERSIIALNFLGTSLAVPDRRLYILHMFEGREASAPRLEAADAIA